MGHPGELSEHLGDVLILGFDSFDAFVQLRRVRYLPPSRSAVCAADDASHQLAAKASTLSGGRLGSAGGWR